MKKNMFKKLIKGVVCTAMAMAVSITGLPYVGGTDGGTTATKTAEAATVTNRVPLVCYTRNASGNLTTYSDASLKNRTGYICYYDQCTILNVYNNGVVRVRYPVSRGTRIAYAAMSGFFENNDFSSNTMKLGTGKTAYRKSTGNATIGSVYASDDVVIVGQANGRTELIYPTSSGYKLGWVAGSYSISSSNELRAPATWAISEEQALTVLFQAKYYANSYSDLKAVFGYDEKRLYEHYLTYGIREGRSASPIFDPVYYLNNNADLKKAFGNDYTRAYRHWYCYGCKEGRASSKFYNGNYYRTRYGDLHKAFFGSGTGDGYLNLAQHYLTFGINEKRWANSNGYIPNMNTDQSVSNNNSYTTQTVQITSNGQTVDTFHGVSARYIKGTGNSNTGEYCCARYVSNYYKTVYGVTVSNMFTGRTPSVSSGYFYQTNSPMAGDIGYQLNKSNSGHWFIIKAVNGDGSYTVIEQNWKWADNGRTYCYKNRKVYNSTKGFKVFRWSRR